MAEIQENDSGGRKKGKQKKIAIRVDFTPMVDMNMLLITFFMLCTTMSKPQTMEISMPRKDVKDESEQDKLKASEAITVLLGKDNKVYYYEGLPSENYENTTLVETNFSADPDGLRAYLLRRNGSIVQKISELDQRKKNLEITDTTYNREVSTIKKEKGAPAVVIKASDFATYTNLMDVLDEMLICKIGRYSIVDIEQGDLFLLKEFTKDESYVVHQEVIEEIVYEEQ
ncbi:MAG: biopolymer transporter ExbD [Odoribacteraceae bacterium]|jgi:biopolymer transport protein ExbD|nr:biopolymer transporter ExbD [Odoribacteraceae bacterium]